MSRASNLAGFTTAIGVPPSNLNVGVITVTSFSGSVDASNLTGTLPAISGENLTSLPAGQLTGALPAIDGSALTGTGVGTETSINTTGIITAASFSGDGSSLTGTGVGTDTSINTTGIITATSFVGSGSSLTDTSAAYNMIDNSEFLVNQRGGTSYTPSNPGVGAFTLDRWKLLYNSSVNFEVTQDTDAPDGFKYSLKVENTSQSSTPPSYQYGYISHAVEGYNATTLNWTGTVKHSATLSFYVKASIAGTWCVTIASYNDSYRYVATYTIDSADTWERKTITISPPSGGTFKDDNNHTLRIYFDLGHGTIWQTSTTNQWITGSSLASTSSAVHMSDNVNSTFKITGVQLEAGTSASDYVHQTYYDALLRCQRYYKRVFVFPEINSSQVLMGEEGSATVIKYIDLDADVMRASPSISLINNSDIEVKQTNGTYGSGNNFNSSIIGDWPYIVARVSRSSDSTSGASKRVRKGTAGNVLMEVSADI